MMRKKLQIVITSIILSTVIFTTAKAYSDVDNSTYYKDAINWFSDQGIIQGYPDGTFRPNDCVRRSEFLKMLYLADELNAPDVNAEPFPDVDYTQWYAKYVNFFTSKHVVSGYPDGTFNPSQCVKRTEAMKMAVWEFNNFTGVPYTDPDFANLPPNITIDEQNWQWWYGPLVYSFSKNLIPVDHLPLATDNPDHIYSLNINYDVAADMTRAEVAEFLYRLKTIKDNDAERYYPGQNPQPVNRPASSDPISSYAVLGSCSKLGNDWHAVVTSPLDYSLCAATNWLDSTSIISGSDGKVAYLTETSSETIYGQMYYLTFSNSSEFPTVKPFIALQSVDYYNYGDRGGVDFDGWADFSLTKSDADLRQIVKKDYAGFNTVVATEVSKYKFGTTPAYLVKETIQSEVGNPLDELSTFYVPYIQINGDQFHLRVIVDAESINDLINLTRSLVSN